MSETAIDLTITIVSWNTKELLRGCLKSLNKCAEKINYEIHVVDNASSDNSVEMVKDEFPHVRLFANKENLGFAKANNQSWREAKGRYWLLLNSDTEIQENALESMIEFMDSHTKAGLATPRLIYPDGKIQHCAQPVPGILRIILEVSRLHKLLPQNLRGRILLGTYFNYEVAVSIGWAWGTALIARRETIEETGALSEDFFMYGEDLEWCLRLRQKGWQIWFIPQANVLHHKEQSAAIQWNENIRKKKMIDGFYKALGKHHGKIYVKTFRMISSLVWRFEKLLGRLTGKPSEDVNFYVDYYKSRT